jgi:hypothetical protein
MAAETWQMTDPRRPHPDRPVIDDDSADALGRAVHQLSIDRAPPNDGHARRLHVLASLIAQAEALLPDAVADARDRDFYWSEIAAELGVTAGTARRRYRHHAQTRSLPLEAD